MFKEKFFSILIAVMVALTAMQSLRPKSYNFYHGKPHYVQDGDRYNKDYRKTKIKRPHRYFGRNSRYRVVPNIIEETKDPTFRQEP